MEKKNPLWFRAKEYGWGWYPATWQGWAVIFVFLVIFSIHTAFFMSLSPELKGSVLGWFLVRKVVLISVFIYICYRTGEKPEWRWGSKRK